MEKKPGTNSQRIVLFAYYRRHVEQIETFDRQALKSYFARARIAPPANYDRDFAKALSSGWIHEDGGNSYITTTGEQLVEAGFEGQRTYPMHVKRGKRSSTTKAKKRAALRR